MSSKDGNLLSCLHHTLIINSATLSLPAKTLLSIWLFINAHLPGDVKLAYASCHRLDVSVADYVGDFKTAFGIYTTDISAGIDTSEAEILYE